MKKFYLLAFSCITGLAGMNAQSSLAVTDINNGMASVSNNSNIYYTTTANQHITTDIDAKNTSSATKYYKLKRMDDVLNPNASAYFCIGSANCYPPATTVSPITMTLTPGQTLYSQNISLLLDLEESATPGYSSIRYQIYNINDANDVFTFTLKYNDNGVSVKELNTVFASVSGVYPNPSSGKASINLNANFEGGNVAITVSNTLGAVVYSKTATLSAGKNTVALDVDNLVSGVYFATLSSGNTVITRKFTINK